MSTPQPADQTNGWARAPRFSFLFPSRRTSGTLQVYFVSCQLVGQPWLLVRWTSRWTNRGCMETFQKAVSRHEAPREDTSYRVSGGHEAGAHCNKGSTLKRQGHGPKRQLLQHVSSVWVSYQAILAALILWRRPWIGMNCQQLPSCNFRGRPRTCALARPAAHTLWRLAQTVVPHRSPEPSAFLH